MTQTRRGGIWKVGRFLRIFIAAEFHDWADRLDPDAVVDQLIRSGTLPPRPDEAPPSSQGVKIHDAKVIEHDPSKVRGYPSGVNCQTSCSTCGTGYGPITLNEAKAWVRGHNSAVSRTAYLRDGRYCSVHGIDLVPPDRTLRTRRYCPQCFEDSPLGCPTFKEGS